MNFLKSHIFLFLFLIIIFNSCQRNGKDKKQILSSVPALSDTASLIQNINVFIENSGSMKSFFEVGQIADKTIHDLDVNLTKNYPNTNIKYYLIANNNVISIKINRFNGIPITFNGNNTDIPIMLDKVISATGPHSLNIFFSDFIYANGKGSVILDRYKSEVNKILDPYKGDLIIYQLFTKINLNYPGIYYQGSLMNTPNHFAPFYLFVFGNNNALKKFDSTISLKFESPEGISIRKNLFERNSSSLNQIKYKISPGSSSSIGIVGIKQGSSKFLTEIVKMKKGRGSNKVQFSILFSNINLFVPNSYIENTENYNIKPSYFKLEQIKKHNDPLGVFTHELIVSTTNILNDTLSIKLKEHFAQKDESIVTDPCTTFGLDYLIKGVKDSYDSRITNDKTNFEIKVPIHIKQSHSILLLVLLLLMAFGGYMFHSLKFRKRKSR